MKKNLTTYFENQSKVIKIGLVIGFIVITLKLIYSSLIVNDLKHFIYPTQKIVAIFSGYNFIWEENLGYVNETLNICINKSCAGGYFFIILFTLLLGLLLFSPQQKYNKFVSSIVLVFIVYGITVFANSSRIIVFLQLSKFNQFQWLKSDWFHQFLGGVIYVLVLIVSYHISHKILIHDFKNK